MDDLKTSAHFKIPTEFNTKPCYDTFDEARTTWAPVELTPTSDIQYRFNESAYLSAAGEYVAKTYSQHYVGPTGYQAYEGVAAAGNGKGFAMGNIQKLAARYGKKEGYNRNDLYKIIHYALLEMWRHDTFGEE